MALNAIDFSANESMILVAGTLSVRVQACMVLLMNICRISYAAGVGV